MLGPPVLEQGIPSLTMEAFKLDSPGVKNIP
jgi:hypothetical protein